ncbi:beta-glucosidase [Dichomitus squalens LYAD-421 SS1]|uniref:beta-glucosidase n=1 Tax=Dichomitus squalens (strain LYAD-421) TaxID=732165 RepID=UPI0004410732|nr:beta-glucosidase [Dichomitus squalens LYAD-421 SS1]EJF66578.1 beta-glucosidase [Dichomitus squalens LYAD-421 SS1]
MASTFAFAMMVPFACTLALCPSLALAADACTTGSGSNLTTCSPGYACQTLNDTSICVIDQHTPSNKTPSKAVIHTEVANIAPEWAAAYAKAKPVVANLSNTDKSNLGTGLGQIGGPCIGTTPSISAIHNFSGLCLQDSPVGVRFVDGNSVFPAEINAAATWNRTLFRQRGAALGAEFRGKGVNVALGPMMNLMRAPAAGRNWEGAGGDPFLTGEVAYETVIGIQSQGVQACAKHYINNEQEHFRDSSSSNVDDKYQHELYAHPFLRSVQANVASVMCSYNQINGTYACENDKTLNGILKGELGFQGYVMSDWYATHSTTPAANGGLDMTMPGDEFFASFSSYFGSNLVNAVTAGDVPQERLDDMATRILAGWYLLGQDSGYPAVNFNSWLPFLGDHVNVQADHASLIRTIGAASAVLLKNEKNTLPLGAPKTMAIVGTGARSAIVGPNECLDHSCNDGVLGVGWGSGTASYPYITAPLDAISDRAKADGTSISSWTLSDDANLSQDTATGKDVALVFITADSGEASYTVEGNAGDRNDLQAWHSGDDIVEQVASVNNNTIVVINSVGPIIVDAWIENPNVTAVIWAGLPGQEAGNALTDVLYGDVNPSGKIPFTIAKQEPDYSARVIYDGSGTVQINYTEGLLVDYRHFDANNIEPRFEFGFGLSYTTFAYSDLAISGSTAGGSRQALGPGSSLDPWLHDPVVNVSFTVTNTGSKAGTEVVQLYTSPPASANQAPNNLKGFDAVFLNPGESKTVTLQLSRYDFSVWDVVSQSWQIATGETGISVGASSRDLRLKSSITN